MKRFLQFIKLTIIGVVLGFLFLYASSEYLLYKLQEEKKKYFLVENDIKALSDTYYLCLGLLMTTRSKQDHKTCQYIRDTMLEKADNIESELKYNQFVKEYLK